MVLPSLRMRGSAPQLPAATRRRCTQPPRAHALPPPGMLGVVVLLASRPPLSVCIFYTQNPLSPFFSACISPHNANWPPNPLKASPISNFHLLGSPGTHLHPNVPSEALQRPPFALSAPFSTLRPSGPPHLVLLAPQNPPLAFKVPLKTPHLAPWPPQYHLGPLCRHLLCSRTFWCLFTPLKPSLFPSKSLLRCSLSSKNHIFFP